ncbi:MAG TPA: class I SAM-dependent methyltransferase [Thermoanaerobaculia bacterium]|nr:class I SAM-dependent methyltransferase [Thermoanaerobaculia bacterium]
MPNIYQFKDFDGSSHRILIRLIRRHSRNGGLLVDLGAAGGELGEAVRGRFDRTIGFELDLDRMQHLRTRFDQVVIADLERLVSLPRASVIVMADVLEHLRDPSPLLRLVRSSLTDDGHLYVSVPNIANVTTRIGLLFGVFRYRDRGILDATHLRFYTMKTIREEIARAGFEIITVRGSSIPIRLIIGTSLPDSLLRLGERVLSTITQTWRALFAYQIILVARPR